MKKYFLFLVTIFPGISLYSQSYKDSIEVRPLNTIYINLLGDASLVSVNYEKLIPLSSSIILASKLGVGYHGMAYDNGSEFNIFTIPHHITGNIGKGSIFVEMGLGGTWMPGSSNTNRSYYLYPIGGIRIQPPLSMMVCFRLFGLLPVGGFNVAPDKISPIGLSLGISF